jgi:hypothetical protein
VKRVFQASTYRVNVRFLQKPTEMLFGPKVRWRACGVGRGESHAHDGDAQSIIFLMDDEWMRHRSVIVRSFGFSKMQVARHELGSLCA